MFTQFKNLIKLTGIFIFGLLLTFPAIGHEKKVAYESGDVLQDILFCQGDEGIVILDTWMKAYSEFGSDGLIGFYNQAILSASYCTELDTPSMVGFEECVIYGHTKPELMFTHYCIYSIKMEDQTIEPYYGILFAKNDVVALEERMA